jgi:hypothetical protein
VALTRVLVDGRNVQRALERGSAPGSLPTAALVGRLRAAFPRPIEVELILDGHAGPTPTGRIMPGFSVVYSRHLSADFVIAERVVDALKWLGPADVDSVLVISDDREVTGHARRHGTRVQGTSWLAAHMDAAAAAPAARGTSIGQGRPPRSPNAERRTARPRRPRR